MRLSIAVPAVVSAFVLGGGAPAIARESVEPSAASEPLVSVEYCPFRPERPHDLRCFTRRLVPRSVAEERRLAPESAPSPKYADAGPLAACDGNAPSSFGGSTSGLGATDLAAAYAIPTSPTGAGKIIAIVDPCANATIVSDLAAYRQRWGLPALPQCGGANGHAPTADGAPCFGVVSQTGGADLPPPDSGWGGEIAVDVDMVSASCPDCSILLVEAQTPNIFDVAAAENEAVALHADAVSNSYGGDEDPSDPAGPEFSDGTYVSAFTHPGVLIGAASGDQLYLNEAYPPPYAPTYPASIPSVLAVGGATLTRGTGSSRGGFTEVAWNDNDAAGTGSGCSTEFPLPAYQQSVDMGSCKMRGTSDVAGPAEYSGGAIAIYVAGSWQAASGTSMATPFVTALLTRSGLASKPNDYFYENRSAFFDVTSGNNDPKKTCTDVMCNAGAGWDGPTGWGTPNGAALAALGGLGGSGGSGTASGGSGSKGCACALSGRGSAEVPLELSWLAAVGGLALLVRLRRARRRSR